MGQTLFLTAGIVPSAPTPSRFADYLATRDDSNSSSNQGWSAFRSLKTENPLYIRKSVCCFDRTGGELVILAVNTEGTLMFSEGVIAENLPDAWSKITSIPPPVKPARPGLIEFYPKLNKSVSCSVDAEQNFHVCVIDEAGRILYTVNESKVDLTIPPAFDNWQENWTDISSKVPGGPGESQGVSLSCAADQNGNLHLFVIDVKFSLWHTVRNKNKSWQSEWDLLSTINTSGVNLVGFTSVSCAVNKDNELEVCTVGRIDGRLYYKIFGTDFSTAIPLWTDILNDIKKSEPGCNSSASHLFLEVSCDIDSDNNLHIFGLEAPIGFESNIYYTRRSNGIPGQNPSYLCLQNAEQYVNNVPGLIYSLSIAHD